MEHLFTSVLRWFKSYLSDRYNFVHVNDESSRYQKVSHGVPQGSVVGPLLFTLYMLPVDKIIRQHSVLLHCSADNTQLYLSMMTVEMHQLANLQN